jgi:hypothetical protein
MPNTRVANASVEVVSGTAVDWVGPAANACLSARSQRLVVAASSTRGVSRVRFTVDGRVVAVIRHGSNGLWETTVETGRLARGRHVLVAVANDAKGGAASARRIVRLCR